MAVINPPMAIQARTDHPASAFRKMLQALRGVQGVAATGDMLVTQNGTPNMSVNVAAGKAVIDGTENAQSQGSYLVHNDATVNLVIAASDPTNPRNDLVVAKVQDSQYSGGTDAWSLVVVTGTPAGSPVDPATPANGLVLARVRVDALVTTILNAKITNLAPVGVILNSVDAVTAAPAGTGGSIAGTSLLGARADHAHKGIAWLGEFVLGAPAASVTFSGISGLYRHLSLEMYGRGDNASTFVTAALQFNGDVGTSYIGGYVVRTGNANPTGAAPAPAVSLPVANITAATGPATYSGGATIKILGYSGTTFAKSVVSFNENQHGAAAAGQEQVLYSGNWAGTAAITSIKVILSAGNFIAGSVFSLYGLP